MTGRVFVVGSINADDSIRLARLPGPGETVSARTIETALGGKGANQAVAAARAGAKVAMIGAVGLESDTVLDALRADVIDISGVARLDDVLTGRAIVLVDDAAENSIVVVPGANNAIPTTSIEALGSRLGVGDVLLLQHEVPIAVSRLAGRLARAAGATVIWNAAPAPTSRADLVDEIDMLIVNEHELADIASLLDVADPEASIEAVLGSVGDILKVDVVCTLGADGAAYIVEEQTGRAAARRVRAVDTTAAGDTFVGYFAANADLPFAARLRFALHAGSLTVTRTGASASIPTHAEVTSSLASDTSEMSRI